MKHTIIITSFAMWVMVATTPRTAKSSYGVSKALFSSNVAKIKIKAGLGKGSNCRGRGLCLIIDVQTVTDGVQSENQALAMAEYSGNTLTLEFLKNSMTSTTMSRHFANGEFTIEEDTRLDAGPVSPKNSGKSLLIPKGKYTVEDMGRSYQVTLENCTVSS